MPTSIPANVFHKSLAFHFTTFHNGSIGFKSGLYAGNGTNLTDFNALLDYLVTVKDTSLWVSNYLEVFKYRWERQSAIVAKLEATPSLVRLSLNSSCVPHTFTFTTDYVGPLYSSIRCRAFRECKVCTISCL